MRPRGDRAEDEDSFAMIGMILFMPNIFARALAEAYFYFNRKEMDGTNN